MASHVKISLVPREDSTADLGWNDGVQKTMRDWENAPRLESPKPKEDFSIQLCRIHPEPFELGMKRVGPPNLTS